jgi:hypothetical protein
VNGVVRGPFGHNTKPLTTPINGPPWRFHQGRNQAHLLPPIELLIPPHFSHVQDQAAFVYLIPTFGAHHVRSLKTTLTMRMRRVSQHLHPNEGLLQTSDQNQPPLQQPSTETLPTINEATELTFDNIPEVQLQ